VSDTNGAANSVEMLLITDPGNNYAFEVHQYLDGDSSGQANDCVSTTIGAERLATFTNWLKTNNKQGFLGEIGGGNTQTCQSAVAGALAHMESNSDVWLGWTWWAAGYVFGFFANATPAILTILCSPWWPSGYYYLLQPTNNYATDAPQMAWLAGSIPTAGVPQALAAPKAAPAPVAQAAPTRQVASPSAPPTFVATGSSVDYFGVNLACAEFGSNVPGTFNTDYTWPSDAEVNYFVTSKKMKIIRLPFLWERLQTSLNATFNSAELARLQAAVQSITSRGAVALLDPHNYARYSDQIIGSSQVPYGAFYDFWSRLAGLYKTNSLVWFGLMNEPNAIPTEQWLRAAQTGINVRSHDLHSPSLHRLIHSSSL
jgi:aryl-phospho-beta-D-glucosidase BglC (GH1 family)